jgi:hypothetical protein
MPGGSAIGVIVAGALGTGTSKRITLTAGISNYVVPPAAGTWQYLKVTNNHATAIVSVGINEVPAAAPATSPTPALVADWKIGYDIPPGGSEVIPITGTLTSINVLSDTATTPVVLNLIA